ncbi:MAG: DUF3489 domain-containing protein [Hyphomonadaceae bacterium]|nr:DUF3489 domain-containing protein [Hyphomonadaceae bacterium]
MTKKPHRKVRATAPKKPTARSTPPKSKASKLSKVIAALQSPKGTTVPALMQITGWQAHSVRGALSGALKKDRGLTITSEKSGAERVYRIESGR